MTDEAYIHRCEELGRSAKENGNPPVGALIVVEDRIISEAEEGGRSKNDITCHAEIEAIRVAVNFLQSNDLSDCILYTSHEPCIMCSYVIRFHRIRKVVFLHKVEYLGGYSSSMALLTGMDVPPSWSRPPEVVCLDNSEEEQ